MDSLSLAGPPCRISEDKVGGALSCGKVRQRQNILSGSGGRLAAGDRKPFLSHRGSRVPGFRATVMSGAERRVNEVALEKKERSLRTLSLEARVSHAPKGLARA